MILRCCYLNCQTLIFYSSLFLYGDGYRQYVYALKYLFGSDRKRETENGKSERIKKDESSFHFFYCSISLWTNNGALSVDVNTRGTQVWNMVHRSRSTSSLFWRHAAWCPIREEIASCGSDKTIRIWRCIDGAWKLYSTLVGEHKKTIRCVEYSPDGQYFILFL